MARKKQLNEMGGMVGLVSLLPVGGVIGLPTHRKTNFEFKGLPSKIWADQKNNEILVTESSTDRMLSLVESHGQVMYNGVRLTVKSINEHYIFTNKGNIKISDIKSYEIGESIIKLNNSTFVNESKISVCSPEKKEQLQELLTQFKSEELIKEIWRGLSNKQSNDVYDFIKRTWNLK